jgi:POT family proton-dependent oligopeptide transporter
MMGVWFMGSALGNLMAGLLGGLFESLALPSLFGAVFLTTSLFGVALLLSSGWINRLAGIRPGEGLSGSRAEGRGSAIGP